MKPSVKSALAEAEETEPKKIWKGEALTPGTKIQMLSVALASGDLEELAELESAADPQLAEWNVGLRWRLQL